MCIWVVTLSIFVYFASSQNCSTVTFTNDVIALSKTTTTLQVVSNPILDPRTSPVAAQAWQTLADLGADFVRYVPWFPYPKVAVAELLPPANGKTFWNFEDIIPQFYAFMNATVAKGHTVIPNFSTQPTWMFDTNDWSFPSDPNYVDWSYPKGGLRPNTTENVAKYYGRLLSWMINGEFVDEYGVRHTGGPRFPITHWEIFNEVEAEHSLSSVQYNQLYDAVVKQIRADADPDAKIQFVGLALAFGELDRISYFLDPKNHDPAALPLNYISFHFYAGCSEAYNPDKYEEFFTGADGFIQHAIEIQQIRENINPSVKIDADELGCIIGGWNGSPYPGVYWNACGGMYAYLWANLVPVGYEILGQSQLAGSPAIPEWNIPDLQFPDVSLINWTTGRGNARYWILKLLVEYFQPGDKFLNTTITFSGNNYGPSQIFCPEVSYGIAATVKMYCVDPSATISKIMFAGYGTVKGTCGNYQHDPSCDAKNVTEYVSQHCLGQNSCEILSYPTFGDPCYGTPKRLVIQAMCSGNSDGNWSPRPTPVFSQAVFSSKTNSQKLLLINKMNMGNCVKVPFTNGAMVSIIDESVGDNPARVEPLTSATVSLAPFAVAIVHY